jgi:thiol-disulfide isomerase/thioredoxin
MMGMKFVLAYAIGLVLYALPCLAQDAGGASAAGVVEIVRFEKEYSHARLEPARMDGQPGLAVIFEGTEDLHYYARAETAPSPDLQLKVEAAAPGVEFGPAVFPAWRIITDPTGRKAEVYAGAFRVFVPIQESSAAAPAKTDVTVRIGELPARASCACPFTKTLTATSIWPRPLPVADRGTAGRPAGDPPYGTIVYCLLAAGRGCLHQPHALRAAGPPWYDETRHESSVQRPPDHVRLAFRQASLVCRIRPGLRDHQPDNGAVLDLNALFRYPAAVVVLFLAIVLFGLVMLDVVTLSLPSALASRQSTASGIAGTVGMGFFAGVLSTPCSGALLGFVLVWAQTQPLLVSSTAIVLMGVGMALPYAVLVLVPSLIDRLPKPGYWMEVFKKSTAFLLFFIAVKLTLAALPKEKLLNVLTYGIVFSFCAWMWGMWVDLATPAPRKWTIRATAAAMAVIAGLWLLPLPGRSAEAVIDWQPYDARLVQQAVAQRRPVLLDFMADWCTNCKIVDRRVYQDPQIAKLIREKGVLPVRADTTVIDYPATKDLKQVYGEAGNVPVNIALLPDGSQEKWRGIFDKEELAQILKKLPEAKAHGREENVSQDNQGGQAERRQGEDLR